MRMRLRLLMEIRKRRHVPSTLNTYHHYYCVIPFIHSIKFGPEQKLLIFSASSFLIHGWGGKWDFSYFSHFFTSFRFPFLYNSLISANHQPAHHGLQQQQKNNFLLLLIMSIIRNKRRIRDRGRIIFLPGSSMETKWNDEPVWYGPLIFIFENEWMTERTWNSGVHSVHNIYYDNMSSCIHMDSGSRWIPHNLLPLPIQSFKGPKRAWIWIVGGVEWRELEGNQSVLPRRSVRRIWWVSDCEDWMRHS